MIFYTLEIVYSIPNLTPKHNPHRKLSAFLLCQKHNSVWFTSCFPHGDITKYVLPGSHTQTHPDRAAHAALVTVVGLHLQHMRAARLSVQSHSSSADESRQTVHAKLTIVSYREQTSHTHTWAFLPKYFTWSPRLETIMIIYVLSWQISESLAW